MAIINAGSGTTNGTAENDIITGTDGVDNIYGGDGDDIIYGNGGNDNTRGQSGSDTLFGGAGNDQLDGGLGADVMYGGLDNDTYIVDDSGDQVIEAANEGTDTVRSYIESYTLPANVEILDLNFGSGIVGIGNDLNNTVRGNGLANRLYGMDGNDNVNGQGGDDLIVGGAGAMDQLFGGTGADRFEFSAADSALANAGDAIGDLNFAEGDTIALLGLGNAGGDVLLASYQDTYEFVRDTPGVTAGTNGTGRLILTIPNGSNTQVINIHATDAWAQFQAANPAPVANNDLASTGENTAILVDVLANDSDDTPLTLVSAAGVAGQGSVTIEGGKVRFDPGTDFDYLTAGQSANAVIAYEVRDQFGKSATATLTIKVIGANEGAIIGGVDTGSVIEDKDILAAGKLTIDDPDGPSWFKGGIYAGEYGFVVLLPNGAWVYTLNVFDKDLDSLDTGESVIDTVTIKSADGTTHDIAITVHGTTDRPDLPREFTGSNDPNDFDGYSGGSLFSSVSNSQLNQANTLRGSNSGDCIDAKAGNDTVYAKGGNDTIDGGQGNDTIFGGSGSDRIDGDQGDDKLYGGSGRDKIDGGQGNDTIVGGWGADTLTGGQGNDRFVLLEARDTNDYITDFTKSSDKIDLSQFKVNRADYTFDAPAKASTFSAGSDLIWYHEGGNTIILGDTDGDFSTAELMITLNGTINLGASDFLL